MAGSYIERLEDDCEKYEEALQRIADWAAAYPTDIFPEPDDDYCRRAHEVLKANGMTLDRLSAHAMRHCLKGIGGIARAALPAKNDEAKAR